MSNILAELAAALPFPLSLVIEEYRREQNPFIKIHRMVDAAEVFTRFASIILLSEMQHSYDTFPDSLG